MNVLAQKLPPLKNNEYPLKIDAWKMYSLLKWSLFRGQMLVFGDVWFFLKKGITLEDFSFQTTTLPETNIAPENGWLEYYFPIGEAYFQGLC